MNQKFILKQILIILLIGIILLGIDSIYLFVNKNAFEILIASVQNGPMQINMTGVILCYILLIFGFYYFIIRENRNNIEAFLMGIFVYGVYETTNYATFKKWSSKLALIDTIWGGVLFALTNHFVKMIINKFM